MVASESVAMDVLGYTVIRDLDPGEALYVDQEGGLHLKQCVKNPQLNPCIFEHVYFSRPDSILGGRSVYETREAIGRELAKEAPVEADLVCPVPDSGTPAAIGFSLESGIPYAMGIIRNQYMGRTFIEPTEQIRNMGVRLKLNVNRALVKGKRIILVDDSVVRGTTSRKIKEMILDAGAAEVHFRIASPPTAWPCFYGVDTPQRDKLLAATMTEDEMRDHLSVDSLKFISLDGLYRAVGEEKVDLAILDRISLLTKRVHKILGNNLRGKKISILGVTFKPNTDDMRDSTSLSMLPYLCKKGVIKIIIF